MHGSKLVLWGVLTGCGVGLVVLFLVSRSVHRTPKPPPSPPSVHAGEPQASALFCCESGRREQGRAIGEGCRALAGVDDANACIGSGKFTLGCAVATWTCDGDRCSCPG